MFFSLDKKFLSLMLLVLVSLTAEVVKKYDNELRVLLAPKSSMPSSINTSYDVFSSNSATGVMVTER